MNPNVNWLKKEIAPLSRVAMPGDVLKESYDFFKESSDDWTDYSLIEEESSTLEMLAVFREKYEALKANEKPAKPAKAVAVKAEKPAKPKAEKASKPKPEVKRAEAKPKKEKDCDCEEGKKHTHPAKTASSDKKTEVKKHTAPKHDTPKKEKSVKADKKPTAAEKQEEKARQELKRLKAENAGYEKRIIMDSDIKESMLNMINRYQQEHKGLGALPTALSQELKQERSLNSLYRRVMKRNVKSFKTLESRIKKSNELTPAMEKQFYALYSTLNGLKQATVAKRTVTKKKNKSFWSRLFS